VISTRRVALFSLLALTVLAPEPILARRTMSVRMPAFDVPPRSDREICTFVPLPLRRPVNVTDLIIDNLTSNPSFATHHVIAFAYVGDLAPLAGMERRIFDDPACTNFGAGPATRQFLALAQGVRARFPTPHGTALRLTPGTLANGQRALGLLFNAHWINGSDETQQARARMKLVLTKDRAVKRQLKPIFDVIASIFIKVPPGETGIVGYRWAPGNPGLSGVGAAAFGGVAPPDGPACVTVLTSHMHRRGKLFTADFVAQDSAPERVYENTVYADPPARRFDPPLLVRVGDEIAYACTHDNATDPRLGCEEVAGVTPGITPMESIARTGDLTRFLGAARLCHIPGPNPQECPPGPDPLQPDRTLTGNCVPANLVFGFLSEDDMCALPGYYYDAAPAAPPGQECIL